MENFIKRDSNSITISTFWENYQLEKYNFNPPYQRRSVWSDEKHSYLIDSIMKNFPMPPIFLRQIVDVDTGKTTYEVIDGKQRLTSIVKFIRNEIPITNEFPVDELDDDNLSGSYFKDLDKEEFRDYKKQFWTYLLPIEYIDVNSLPIIDNIFDRLNRNGEPLKGQELRNAKYHDTELLKTIYDLSNDPFWKERLKIVEKSRMEDTEFISELLFMQLEGKPLGADQEILDKLYETYAEKEINYAEVRKRFLQITNVLKILNLDYSELKIAGVSHLYGLWCLAWYCNEYKIKPETIKDKVSHFYEDLRSNHEYSNACLRDYKYSMSSRTKEFSQRNKRMASLIDYIINQK